MLIYASHEKITISKCFLSESMNINDDDRLYLAEIGISKIRKKCQSKSSLKGKL